MRRREGRGWARLAEIVRRYPGRVLLASMLVLVPPAAAAARATYSYDVLSELPSAAEAAVGYEALSRHFDRGELGPLTVVVQSDKPIWDDASLRAINDLTVAIGKMPGVTSVRSLSQPTGGVISEQDLASAGVGDLASFPDKLEEGANGVARVIDGLGQIRAGLVTMRKKLPELESGLSDAARGAASMREGIRRMRAGIAAMRTGITQAADGLDKPGDRNDLRDLAGAAAADSLSAFNKLMNDPVLAANTTEQSALTDIGTAYGSLTGLDPRTGQPPPGDPDAKSYADAGGMAGSLKTIATGLRSAVDGLSQLDGGLVQIDGGLAQMAPGLQEGSAGVGQTLDGVGRMIGGMDQILPGLGKLRAGLAEGAARVRSMGIGDLMKAGNLGLTMGVIDAVPGLKDRLKFFVSGDGRMTRLLVTLESEPYVPQSIGAARMIRELAPMALNKTPLAGAPVLVAGSAAFFNDIRHYSAADFPTLVIAVVVGIFLVLALLLRSLLAPAYLVLTVLLSFAATLGLTSIVFEGILGANGLPWWLPPFLFVMLVALGADYNIFLMSRIREEAHTHPTDVATARGLALTGHVITSAGLILAGTFAALMAAPLRSLQQFGFSVSVGILLDTFIVRSLTVPALSVLFGRLNWWPSRRARTA